LDRISAVGLIDPHRARCADPMGVQEEYPCGVGRLV
jgi:hypothetical protein